MHIYELTENVRSRIVGCIIILGLIICTCLTLYQFIRYGIYKSVDISQETIYSEQDYCWAIDVWTEKNDIYQISGWIMRKGEDIKTRNLQLIIVNEDGTAYLVPTLMVKRTDITNAFNGENDSFDYDYSGFTTSLNKVYVHSEKCRLYILYENNGRHEIVDIARTFDID